LFDQLPAGSFKITKAIYSDPAQEFKDHCKFLETVANKYNIPVTF